MAADDPQHPDRCDAYGKLFSRRVDLVGDYAGSEPFLVEGDSLLLHCFSDELLDFHDGLQMLHAVWLVERFFHRLLQRKCNFDVVFFDEHEQLCVPSHVGEDRKAKYLLARIIILRHLQAIAARPSSPFNVLGFASLWAPSFHCMLTRHGYMFIMMNDGAADDCSCNVHKRNKSALRLNISTIIWSGYNVALVNGIDWRDTKAIADIIEGSAQVKGLPKHPRSTATDASQFEYINAFDAQKFQAVLAHHKVTEGVFSARLYAVAISTSILLEMDDTVAHNSVAAFLTHAVLQGQLRLGARSCTDLREDGEEQQLYLHQFAQVSRGLLKCSLWQKFVGEAKLDLDIADLVDGRLFSAVCGGRPPAQRLTEESTVRLNELAVLVSQLAGGRNVPRETPLKPAASQHNAPVRHSYHSLLSFSDAVFDKHLEPIRLNVDEKLSQPLTAGNTKTFRELTHWHNSKRPLNRKAMIAAKDRADFFARRRNQRFMAEMMAYAASLTNAVGKVLEPETVVVRGITKKENKQSSNAGTSATLKNKQGSNKQIMTDRIAADRKKKEAEVASKVLNAWDAVCKDIQRARQPAVCHAKAIQYLNSLPTSKQVIIRADVELYALSCLLDLWKLAMSANPKSPNFGLAARVWDSVAHLSGMSSTTETMLSKLRLTVNALGLPFSIRAGNSPDRKLPFDFALASRKASSLTIPLPSQTFQLEFCGQYFDHKMDSAPDSRVPFLPDGWQRKVLDAIDADKSLFVVAPTSAGKTFISFYAMKRVLEGSDDGVIVYVAPTKALVNQIAAEIQARFSKSYKHAGKSVWGIHTRDYRINSATGCQILVTVPHILQIMLLAPANADTWSCHIKRIVFDEVHCIGQADDGIVWEQLLLLAPCPIIALSATVGNPEEFYNWLSSAQKAIGVDLVMVHHPYRYSELRKFVYVPPANFSFTGLPAAPTIARVGLDRGADFRFVHPVAGLVNRARGMPNDFSLEARDCHALWKSMKAQEKKGYQVPGSLDPDVALPNIITQADVISWSGSLKQLLKEWMKDESSPFNAVVQDLGSDLYDLESKGDTHLGWNRLRTSVIPLLCHLQEQSALPAILFNYDRGHCEDICKHIFDQLERAEEEWKAESPVWAKKMAGWEEWKKSRKGSFKRNPGKSSKKPEDGMSKADLEREAASAEHNPWESFNPNTPIDGFHFIDRTKLLQSELDDYAEELKWRGVPGFLIAALSRGVGVHHAGMNRKYRHVVELLFRKGYLRVVIATGTLALGINMPCKTVVFCGDSIFLTALNFRQAAGRAGRRGFDVLGNVVFHGIPVSKVCRLLSSRLPDLTGHFPITTSLVLRLSTLLSESGHAAFATRSVDALLSQTRLYLGGGEERMAVLHHLRFSIEYLRRQFLLDATGRPLNFAGCVAHLYYTENSSFGFHALLKDGYFHRLCAGIRRNPTSTERVLRTLVLVLAHLFGRRPCRQSDRDRELVVKEVSAAAAASPSTVFLPPPPADAAAILRRHNADTLAIFIAYVRTFVAQHLANHEDDALPLSGLKFGGAGGGATGATASPKIRSPFVELSGHGDADESFATIASLCNTVRAGVFLEQAVIPHVPVANDAGGGDISELPLNAYLLDFFKHGDVGALEQANRIRKGDVWFLLNDFSMVLATVVASLENFVGGAPPEGEEGGVLGVGETSEVDVENRLCDGDGGLFKRDGEKEKNEMPVLHVWGKKVRKEVVVESWDDDGSDEEEQGSKISGEASTGGLSDASMKAPAWEDDGEGSLLDVLHAFKKLSEEFNNKFKAIWA